MGNFSFKTPFHGELNRVFDIIGTVSHIKNYATITSVRIIPVNSPRRYNDDGLWLTFQNDCYRYNQVSVGRTYKFQCFVSGTYIRPDENCAGNLTIKALSAQYADYRAYMNETTCVATFKVIGRVIDIHNDNCNPYIIFEAVPFWFKGIKFSKSILHISIGRKNVCKFNRGELMLLNLCISPAPIRARLPKYRNWLTPVSAYSMQKIPVPTPVDASRATFHSETRYFIRQNGTSIKIPADNQPQAQAQYKIAYKRIGLCAKSNRYW